MAKSMELVSETDNAVDLQDARFAELDRIFDAQRRALDAFPVPSAEQRISHLKQLKDVIIRYQKQIIDAIYEDFGCRAADETLLAEIFPSVEGIRYAARHVKRWMKPGRRKVGLAFMPGKARVIYQPLGVVGIIVPWNYPVYLAIGPLTYALAAGNRAIVKMSEYTPRMSELFRKMIAETFREDEVAVITGDADIAAEFSKKPWDHLLFTGATAIGRHVMRAAADTLTPVTLELGGKSPAIIGPETPVSDAAERIAFGKCLNAGQTCVAPDYVLCPRSQIRPFVSAMQDRVAKMYPTMKTNPQYTGIVNDRQYKRIRTLLADARQQGAQVVEINPAGEDFSDSRKMPTYVLTDVTEEMAVMQEEIFGPLLPVLPYDTLHDAVEFVNRRPRPLALYYFGYNSQQIDFVSSNTFAGGMAINDVLIHVAQDDLPFGGVGNSGTGRYHGREGFANFSNAKGVLIKPRLNSSKLIYPPYGSVVHKLIYKIFIR